jgi:hydroxypyruvate isomerase
MPKFSANLSMMFTEYPFLARFDAARESGFDAVEFLFPYAHSAAEIGVAVEKKFADFSF